jgi:hypothetical protein
MPPEHARSFAGGANATTLDPIVVIAMFLALILIFVLPRKWVMAPLFFMMFLVPLGEQLYVGGAHLYVFRILILFGLFRMLWTKIAGQTVVPWGLNSVDRAFLWCSICGACAVLLLFMSGNALINQAGILLDTLGGYFLIRFLLQDEDDVFRAIKCLAFLALIIGTCMAWEHLALQNVFGWIGGATRPELREGRFRCQGPFAHALMAGAFGSTLIPLFLLLWKRGGAKTIAGLGLMGSALMTWTSNSSTPLMSFAAGMLVIFFWPFRKKMRTLRWGMVIGLMALQLVMKAPVWFLIARVDLTGGSSGYHRAELIDQFIRHFWDWWLIGVKGTGSWGWDLWDVQDQFVATGEAGGLAALVFLIAMISRSFARLGNARKAVEGDAKEEWYFWLLGAALFSTIVGFIGVNYFDQTKFLWFALLAIISTATAPLLQPGEVPEVQANIGFSNAAFAYSSVPASGLMARGPNGKASPQFQSREPAVIAPLRSRR